MKYTWIALLLFSMFFVGACSSGGEDVPEPTPKPETKPETKPSITFASTAEVNPVFNQEGGEVTISFIATEDWTASVTNTRADNWITVSPTSGGKGENTITITTTANDTYDERNATISLKCGTVTESVEVGQKQLDALIIENNEYFVEAEGQSLEFNIRTNINFDVEIDVDWIKQVESRGLKDYTLLFEVNKNEKDKEREGHIILQDQNGNIIQTITVKQNVSDVTPYVRFEAEEVNCFIMYNYIPSSLEYSLDGGEWCKLEGWPIAFGGDYGSLRLRGKSSIGTAENIMKTSNIGFTDDEVKVNCSGDIRTLIDYENYDVVSTSNAKFIHLFLDCKCLVTAPELPARDWSDNCYLEMFMGCINLVEAPELPATVLAESCYNGMFSFCKNLKKVPILPANKLEYLSYHVMFKDCSSLNNVAILATDVSTRHCMDRWLEGVSPTGTFTKAKEMTSLPTGVSGIPEGWEVVDYEE